MNKFIRFDSLTQIQKDQYKKAISNAFPSIIGESQVIKNYWPKLEEYFPEYQLFLISDSGELIGFMNMLPFQFGEELNQLPDRGWDWMFTKGIKDFDNKIKANYLGGLQVIVRRKYKSQGYSKIILNHVKQIVAKSKFSNLVIPIRPIFKHKFPMMSMSEYLSLKNGNEVYDPWIRTHLNGGADVIKVCNESMIMKGDIKFWEAMFNRKIITSGQYELTGALSLITINIERDSGRYVEPNIWIKY